jgi:hypothetical protein
MPNHIHLLISEPAKGTPSTVMQVLKQRVSRRMRRKKRKQTSSAQLNLRFDRLGHALPQFWQPRFYDFPGAGSTWSPLDRCLEPDKVRRKAAVHAHESSEQKASQTSEGLALEQLLILREEGIRAGSHRSHVLILVSDFTSRTPAFKKPKTGTPPLQNRSRHWPARIASI